MGNSTSAVAFLSEPFRGSRRRVFIVMVVLAIAIVIAVGLAMADPFSSSSASGPDNGSPTALQTVQRRSLTAQQPLTGTLGYAGVWSLAVPSATSASDLQQAEQQVTAAHAVSVTASAAIAADSATFKAADAALQAARLKEASDCAGANAAAPTAAVDGTSASNGSTSPNATSPCAASMQTADSGQQTFATAQQKLAADRAQENAAQATLESAQQALAAAQAGSVAYGSTATFTMLPSVGDIVSRGQAAYSINGISTLLLYGATPAWRSFSLGMTPGRDVAELNANLGLLGLGATGGDQFTDATKRAVELLQQQRGLPVTGSFVLGSVAFLPGAARVTAVTPTVGESVQAGPIITFSSTQHSVSVQLDAAQQTQVKLGNRVLVTLPDNSTTPGIVSFVGKVASAASGQSATGGASGPSIPVNVRLLHPAAAGTLDQAPVNVLITTGSVRNALVVPVNALVALAGGGYAIEIVASSGAHQLVAVMPGLFDDEDGLVQVKGAGVAAGQRVVVPASS